MYRYLAIAALTVALGLAGYGLYRQGQSLALQRADIAALRDDLTRVDRTVGQALEAAQAARKQAREANAKLQELKRTDPAVSDWLAQPIPDSLRDALNGTPSP